jgi:SSS family solute:Na+ symporter
VFPYFLTTHLPVGMSGLFLASLVGAAMAGLSGDLNCLGSIVVADWYKHWRPQASDRDSLRLGRLSVAVCGILNVGIAVVLAHAASGALALWFTISAIASGGLAGLFLLAFCSSRANRRGVWAGLVACTLFTIWAAMTAGGKRPFGAGVAGFTWHDMMIGAVGNVLVMAIGYGVSCLFPREHSSLEKLTIWNWLRSGRRDEPEPVAQPAVRGS